MKSNSLTVKRQGTLEEIPLPPESACVFPASTLPIIEELSPSLEPVEAFRRLADWPHVLFLDSSQSHPSLGRYSYVTAAPFGGIWSTRGQMKPFFGWQYVKDSEPFAKVDEYLKDYEIYPVPGLPPFQGGIAGVFGYDLCHHIERLPRPRFDEFEVPDLAVGFYDWVIAFDHRAHRNWLISSGCFPRQGSEFRRLRAERRVRAVKERLAQPPEPSCERLGWERRVELSAPHYSLDAIHPGLQSNFDARGYQSAVRRAVDYVHAGDCFQVNLSQRLLYPANVPSVELYLRLRQRNPSPFAGYFDLGAFQVASASPESFLQVRDRQIHTRPIKGTRPRGNTPAEDERLREELRRSTKDRAENVMIVDLLRNDLGRVCEYGSVQVPELCGLETYGTVHHLVSEVTGRLRPECGPVDLLWAAFPGGSVTGAPKVRAMEIIAELEPTARGPYCGSLGFIGFDGTMDLNILIRTFTVGGGWIQFPVGGGIVADSDPLREYEETWHKAAGMLRALT